MFKLLLNTVHRTGRENNLQIIYYLFTLQKREVLKKRGEYHTIKQQRND